MNTTSERYKEYFVPPKKVLTAALFSGGAAVLLVSGFILAWLGPAAARQTEWLVVAVAGSVAMALVTFSGSWYRYELSDATLSCRIHKIGGIRSEEIELAAIDEIGLTEQTVLMKLTDLIIGPARISRKHMSLWSRASKSETLPTLLKGPRYSYSPFSLEERHLVLRVVGCGQTWSLPISRLPDRSAFVSDLLEALEAPAI